MAIPSCVKEELSEESVFVSDQETFVTVDFNITDYEEIAITTKSTLDLVPESRVQNLFVYIFVDGKRVYAHYFDKSNLCSDPDSMIKSRDNTWLFVNRTSNDPNETESTGKLKLKSPLLSGGNIYLVANVNADMVNISPEKLNMIRTEDQIKSLSATLNQEITSRNGYFPMCAVSEGITVEDNKITMTSPLNLKRMDAKVKVNLRVATDNELSVTEDGITTTQKLKEFVPQSWRVVNIPKGAYVVERDSEDCETSGYFDTEAVNFEESGSMEFTYTNSSGVDATVTSPVNSFSFYMLENRESTNKKKSVDKDYHKRDLRLKNSAGEYDMTSGNIWEYAPENGTYLEIKGEVIMDVDVSNEAKTQQLVSAVTYYVHLGDVVHSETEHDAHDNYDVERNTYYTYTITIKGVNAIETEVVTSNDVREGTADKITESESGATGDVYIAKESVYTFDAHYGQRVFCFDAAYIDPDNVTWYVKTPFGKEGIPNKIGDTEVPSGLDYKWVHFLVNDISETEDAYTGVKPYSQNNMKWPGHPDDGFDSDAEKELWAKGKKVMDVVEFTKYIKEQKRLLDLKDDSNDFRKEFDQAWFDKFGAGKKETDDGVWHRSRIYVTVFIDEFYYEVDPITGEEREGLWKEFVNQPNRLMHVLCDNDVSLDGESSATGSVITLRQRSIQTPYNPTNAETAWGCETVDEFKDSYMWYFFENEIRENAGLNGNILSSKGNTSENNGLFNTVKLLDLAFDGTEKWSEFLTYTYPNDYKGEGAYPTYFLNDGYQTLLYSVLQRNRDNNGDGNIDPDEIRWYQASLEQLFGLYMGGLGLSDEAQLYPPSVAAYGNDEKFGTQKTDSSWGDHPFAGCYKWMLKVISSTCRSSIHSSLPVTVWAEEGVSISHYKRSFGWNMNNQSPYSIRCIRNLGLPDPDKASILSASENIPNPLMKAEKVASGYRFDLTNINSKSVRFYTTAELEPGDENSEMSRLYYGFETGDNVSYTAGYSSLKTLLEKGESPCPDGWRTPNMREGALMYLYCPDSNWWDGDTDNSDGNTYILVSSYTSLGKYGNSKKNDKDSWYLGYEFASFGTNDGSAKIRCVKDSHPKDW